MSGVPQTTEQAVALPVRSENVIMGRQDFLSVLFRSIRAELYKLRRRLMPIILGIIAIVIMILGFSVVSLQAILTASQPAENFAPNSCSFQDQSKAPVCVKSNLSKAQLEKLKQEQISQAAAPLHLPGSLNTAVSITNFIGLIILIIIAGTIVGGEYSVGTIRLMLTRGPTRTQFLLVKIGAILICIIVTSLLLIMVGIITGALFNLIPAVGTDFSFFNVDWALHALFYLLIAILGLFTYTMIALCLSTLGKATAAGVAGALIWWALEGVLGTVLGIVAFLNKGSAVGDFLKVIPDYFISNNVSALLANQNHYLTGSSLSSISDLHAWLVLAAYLIVFIGISWWVTQSRDITN